MKGWRDYIAYDKLRIREKAENERKNIESRAEETGETWRSAGKSLWVAKQYHAERPEGVPEHFKVWARYDTNARTMRASRAGGPPMGQVLHRVTRNADSREIIASEVIPHGIEEEEPGTIRRAWVRPQDIITELWYEPEEDAHENVGQAQSSASGLRTGGPDRHGKPEDSAGGELASPARCEDYEAFMSVMEQEEEYATMVKDMIAGPAVGIVRNPFFYGDIEDERPAKRCAGTFIEFGCDPNSKLAEAVAACGVEVIRVDRVEYDILDPESMRKLDGKMIENPGDMWGSLPCTPWTTWQFVNMAKLGEEFREKLGAEREISRRMVEEYIRKAEMVIEAGNRVAFEWPRYCTGWRSTRMWEYAIARDLWVVDFDGCMVGMKNRHGQPIRKMWRVVTNCETLALTLAQFTCGHPPGTHARIEGSTSRESALYSDELSSVIASSWYGPSLDESQPGQMSSDAASAEITLDEEARAAKETIMGETNDSEGPRGDAAEVASVRESEPGVESQTDSVIKGNLSPMSMAESGGTDVSVAIGAMSDASSDRTVLGNRGGYEDVVVEIPTLKDCAVESWDVAYGGLTLSITGDLGSSEGGQHG